ncbi:hypothetical protein VHEMI04970 [[Torrubiella] hemipterigena]|uniref:Uncharacterized protein n=1 Tax=[Torrubiella] hemipterigena TaxID=1531966 RepID=A0A0A1THL8_9HYPO|nr:hypothetical protein VHEMI04970 [[Torrubiella] hemipterigena]
MATPPSVKRRRRGPSPFDHNDELPVDPMLQIDPALTSDYPPLDDDTEFSTSAYPSYGRNPYPAASVTQDPPSHDAVDGTRRSPHKGSRSYQSSTVRQAHDSHPLAQISTNHTSYSSDNQDDEQYIPQSRTSPSMRRTLQKRRESHGDRLPSSQTRRSQMGRPKQRRHTDGPGSIRETDRSRPRDGTRNEHDEDAQDEASSDSDSNQSDRKHAPRRTVQKFHPMFATYGYGLDPQDPRIQMFWPGASMPFTMNGQPVQPSHMTQAAYNGFSHMQIAQMNGQGPWIMPQNAAMGMYAGGFPMPHPHPLQTVESTNRNETSGRHSSWANHDKRRDGAPSLRTKPPKASLFANKKRNRAPVLDEQSTSALDMDESGLNDSLEELDTESEVPTEEPYLPRRTHNDRYRAILPKPPADGSMGPVYHPSVFIPAMHIPTEANHLYHEDGFSEEPVKRKRGRPRGSKTKKRRDDDDSAQPPKKTKNSKSKTAVVAQVAEEAAPGDDTQASSNEIHSQRASVKPAEDESVKQANLQEELTGSRCRNDKTNVTKADDLAVQEEDTTGESPEADDTEKPNISDDRLPKPVPRHCLKENETDPALETAQRLATMQQQAKLQAMREEYEATFALSDDEAPAPLKRTTRPVKRPQTATTAAATTPKSIEVLPTVSLDAQIAKPTQEHEARAALPDSTCPDSMDEPLTQSPGNSKHVSVTGSPVATLSSQPPINTPKDAKKTNLRNEIIGDNTSMEKLAVVTLDESHTFDIQGSDHTSNMDLQAEDSEPFVPGDGGNWAPSDDLSAAEQTSRNDSEVTDGSEPQRFETASTPTTASNTSTAATSLDLKRASHSKRENGTPRSARRPLPSSPLRFQHRAPDASSSAVKIRSPLYRSSPLKDAGISLATAKNADIKTSPSIKRSSGSIPPVSRPQVANREPPTHWEEDAELPELPTPQKQRPTSYVLSPQLPSRTKTPSSSASKISRRRSLQPTSSKRNSLLSLLDEDDDDDDWGRPVSQHKSKAAKSHRHREQDARRSSNRPAKAGIEKYERSERSRKESIRKESRPSARKSLSAAQTCGTNGYSCGKDFCFTCL